MASLRAHVHNGRLVLDEPTDLPEGEVVELVPVDDVLVAGGDYLDPTDRERLHQAIARGVADARAGRRVDAGAVLDELRRRVRR